MRRIVLPLLLAMSGTCCSDKIDSETPNGCDAISLPLTGDPAGPTITDVALEPQPDGVAALATATDPEGTNNMLQVQQTFGVFPDAGCQETPILLHDDLACSGCEESFGVAVSPAQQSLFSEIAAAATWPVTLDFSDLDGHHTSGRVLARVIH